jgi:type IV pilus assembly protein PilP
MSARPVLVVILLLAVTTLGGCSRGTEDLEQWVSEVKSRKTARIEPIPEVKAYESFAYDPSGRRDPFAPVQPQRQQGDGSGPRPDPKRPKEALEEFPLDALRMQGVIKTPRDTFGLVKSPDGIVHRVSVGSYMGQNDGKVVSVSETEIKLNELVADGFGGYIQRPALLALTQ